MASDLTQQTFFVWAQKGHQLRDRSKVKSWLFTTLRREFLNQRRRGTNHPHHNLESAEAELPEVAPVVVQQATVGEIYSALAKLDELHREPLVLFHLESHTYREIAEILEVPIGTVMSRISRGRQQLMEILSEEPGVTPVDLDSGNSQQTRNVS